MRSLTPAQLATSVPGTYGSIIDTMRHTVGADASYLFALTGGRVATIDEDHMDLVELRATMEGNRPAWSDLLTQTLDPDMVVIRHRDDGSSISLARGVRARMLECRPLLQGEVA